MKKCSEIVKSTRATSKTYFQIKVINQGSVIISGLGESRSNRSSWGSFFMLFPYFVYIAHLEALFSRKNLCSWKNQKSLVKEKGKKNRPKEERKSTILSRKEKNCVVIAIGTDVAPR